MLGTDTVSTDTSMLLLHFVMQFYGLGLKFTVFFSHHVASQSSVLSQFGKCFDIISLSLLVCKISLDWYQLKIALMKGFFALNVMLDSTTDTKF